MSLYLRERMRGSSNRRMITPLPSKFRPSHAYERPYDFSMYARPNITMTSSMNNFQFPNPNSISLMETPMETLRRQQLNEQRSDTSGRYLTHNERFIKEMEHSTSVSSMRRVNDNTLDHTNLSEGRVPLPNTFIQCSSNSRLVSPLFESTSLLRPVTPTQIVSLRNKCMQQHRTQSNDIHQ
jgi:hypothetical protein